MGTRQPAIWMGESGSIAVVPGVLPPRPDGSIHKNDVLDRIGFEKRGLQVVASNDSTQLDYGREEVVSPSYYSVLLDDGLGNDGRILCEMTASGSHFTPPTFSPLPS